MALQQVISSSKVNLLGLSPIQLREFVESYGEKPFRAVQLLKWLHQQQVHDFDAMSDISKAYRAQLQLDACTELPPLHSEHLSRDGTIKWLMTSQSGGQFETVYIPEKSRATLCVSSQVGCTLSCSFCSTGKQGFQANLGAWEIVGQLCRANRRAVELGIQPVSNVVFMGMGEPLYNFDNVVSAIQLMLEDNAYGLSKRRVTLSTAGVVPKIDELADHVGVSLAISLHAAVDSLRDELVPLNRKYNIQKLLNSGRQYIAKLPDRNRKITIEYTLIKDINDSIEQAQQLALLLQNYPCKINLIPFNEFDQSDYRTVSNNSAHRFMRTLNQYGLVVSVRKTRGDDILAACGQLRGQFIDKTQRKKRLEKQAQALHFVKDSGDNR